jgi:hypothetical protein
MVKLLPNKPVFTLFLGWFMPIIMELLQKKRVLDQGEAKFVG